MRQQLQTVLNEAVENNQKRRAAMLRLILAAIDDRVVAAKKHGKDGITDDQIHEMMRSMIAQREESARNYDESGQIESAEREREEIKVIEQLMPKQLNSEEVLEKCQEIVSELGAAGLRDMGRAMNLLKERHKGQMDFGQASCVVKNLLRCQQG